ncbi:MAG: aspartyl/asparaginyl beta-hydroxylase domain-containing protein [Flavobacteriales bacterium]|nr:aspartyl/asparaginyl beta-hydroxylase domain-containing protein [Flavobacteriales bacterium]
MTRLKHASNAPELWFADFDGTYLGEQIDFLPKEHDPICHELEKLYPEILKEVSFLWVNPNAFNNYDLFDDKQFPVGSWKKIVLKVWGITLKSNSAQFPIIASLLLNYRKRVTSCQITRLAPNSLIKPHCGETNSIIRIHLGLNVPDCSIEECGIRVGASKKQWNNGKVLCFLDATDHEVWNNSQFYRYVLIVDVLRPDFQSRASLICSRIIISQAIFMVLISLRLKKLAQMIPSQVLAFLAHIFRYPIALISFILNYRINDRANQH